MANESVKNATQPKPKIKKKLSEDPVENERLNDAEKRALDALIYQIESDKDPRQFFDPGNQLSERDVYEAPMSAPEGFTHQRELTSRPQVYGGETNRFGSRSALAQQPPEVPVLRDAEFAELIMKLMEQRNKSGPWY